MEAAWRYCRRSRSLVGNETHGLLVRGRKPCAASAPRRGALLRGRASTRKIRGLSREMLLGWVR